MKAESGNNSSADDDNSNSGVGMFRARQYVSFEDQDELDGDELGSEELLAMPEEVKKIV